MLNSLAGCARIAARGQGHHGMVNEWLTCRAADSGRSAWRRPAGSAAGRMAVERRGSVGYEDGGRRHGGARRRDRGRRARPSWSGCSSIRRSTPPAPARSRERPDRGALSGVRDRPRRAVHLSRPRPARGLCDARPQAARAGRARASSRRWRNGSSARSPPSTCAASGARTASASGCAGPTRATAARTRSPPSASACALGDAARHRAQRRAGPVAFLRHRALRRARAALRRHQPRRPRHCRCRWRRSTCVLRREFEALFGATA